MSRVYLCLDFHTFRSKGMDKTVFSTGLEEQFKNIPESKGIDFEDFVRSRFVLTDACIYASYPNFERDIKYVEKSKGRFYNNVAIRLPQDGGNDLVLMGDIFERDQNRHRQFRVKALLSMDPGITHFEELKLKCDTVVRTGRECWETVEDVFEYPGDEHVRNSALTDDFMLSLNETYVVRDPGAVQKCLYSWKMYLDSREHILDVDSERGYDLDRCKPDIFKAYQTEGSFKPEDYSPVPYIDQMEGQAWSTDVINDTSREALLMHLYVEYGRPQYEMSRKSRFDLKKMFDAFTRNPNVLVDPEAINVRKGSDGGIVRIRDGRVQVSQVEEVPPEAEIEEIEKEAEMSRSSARASSDRAFKNEVRRMVDVFQNSDLPGRVAEYAESQGESVRRRVEADCVRREEVRRRDIESAIGRSEAELKDLEEDARSVYETIRELEAKGARKEALELTIGQLEARLGDADDERGAVEKQLSDSRSSLKEIAAELGKLDPLRKRRDVLISKIADVRSAIDRMRSDMEVAAPENDPEAAFEREIAAISEAYAESETGAYEERVREELKVRYDVELERRMQEIEVDARARVETAREQHTNIRLHVTFELEVPETDSVDRLMREYSGKMREGLRLCKDFAGEKTVLARQRQSMKDLLNGYVMNPFLATALFSPESSGRVVVKHPVERFFLRNLNPVQQDAVERAVSSNGMFLIQGPPGTGKTQVIAEISAQLAASGKKVLIASENNKAVDNAFGRLPKLPFIRPMRILSDSFRKKERKGRKDGETNPYAQERLLDNFYENISDSLDAEVRKYSDLRRYIDGLNEGLEDLRQIRLRMEGLSAAASSVTERIEGLRADLDALYVRRNDIEAKNNEATAEASDLDDRIRALEALEDSETLDRIIAGLSRNGFHAGDHGEPAEVVRALARADRSDLVREYTQYKRHQEYFDMKARKSEADDPMDIVDLNRRIQGYISDNDIDETRDFRTIGRMQPVPDFQSAIDAKDIIDQMLESESAALVREREMWLKSVRDASGLGREILDLKDEIRRLEDDPAYRDLEDISDRFDGMARDMFVKLKSTPSSDSPDDVLQDLEGEIRRAGRELSGDQTGTMEKVGAYRKIIKYLRTEDVRANDRENYNSILLRSVNVIGMTCTSDTRIVDEDSTLHLNNMNIDVVILDEVSKMTFLDLLRPILYGKTVILVGDHKQLSPMYNGIDREEMGRYDEDYVNERDEDEYRRMFETSFFEELFTKTPDSNRTTLTVQYRMHPDIMEVDNVFYGGRLSFGGQESFKDHYLTIPGAIGRTVIGPNDHVVFIDCKGRESKESGSTSYYNESEAEVVRRLLKSINSNCRKDRNGRPLDGEVDRHNDERLSVGVICAYADQARRIRKGSKKYQSFNESSEERFMVKTVDDFQGDERDIIILSMVRTKKTPFLADFHRINVAVSRARRLLVIVGNRATLESMSVMLDGRKVPVYGNMIRAIERKGRVLGMEDITGGE